MDKSCNQISTEILTRLTIFHVLKFYPFYNYLVKLDQILQNLINTMLLI